MDEKIRFLEERKLARTIDKEREEAAENEALPEKTMDKKAGKESLKNATNPIGRAFLRFVHTKHKFNIEDL